VEGDVEEAQLNVADEVIQGIFEETWHELSLKTDGKEPSLGTLNVFITGHNSSREALINYGETVLRVF
jgi:hypothetical protein